MDEEFFKERAKTVREIAEKADPFVKRRLLDLADSYERKPRKVAHYRPMHQRREGRRVRELRRYPARSGSGN